MFNCVVALDLTDYRPAGTFLADFHPYFGAGLGAVYSGARDSNLITGSGKGYFESGSEFSLAYQIFTGLEFDLNEYVSLYGEFRWLYNHDLPGGSLGQSDLGLWNAGVKVRY
jgi:opacity protein-like surface antigen